MRKPYPGEAVVCPDSVSKRPYPPQDVYETKGRDGKIITRGTLRPHKKHHYGAQEECPWVGHPVIVVPLPIPKKPE